MSDKGRLSRWSLWPWALLMAGALFSACFSDAPAPHPQPAATFYRSEGTSMLPSITSGSMIWIERVKAADLKPGDKVVFFLIGMVICHRVVRPVPGFPGCWITRGDANRFEDRWYLSDKNLIGRVTLVIPHPK